jgi:hypothetical protein
MMGSWARRRSPIPVTTARLVCRGRCPTAAVDDHPAVRLGLQTALAAEPDDLGALFVRPGMKRETRPMPERTPDPDPEAPTAAEEAVPDRPSTRPSVDDVGEASFPASDPPAVWTWDPPPRSR